MKQAGYFLVESMVLTVLLMAMVATIALAGKIVTARQLDGVRVQALYLAQAQIAYLEYQIFISKVLPQGSIGWLGDPSDLQQDETTYDVTAQAEVSDANSCLVTAQAQWTQGMHHGSIKLQRQLILHIPANDNADNTDNDSSNADNVDTTTEEDKGSGEIGVVT